MGNGRSRSELLLERDEDDDFGTAPRPHVEPALTPWLAGGGRSRVLSAPEHDRATRRRSHTVASVATNFASSVPPRAPRSAPPEGEDRDRTRFIERGNIEELERFERTLQAVEQSFKPRFQKHFFVYEFVGRVFYPVTFFAELLRACLKELGWVQHSKNAPVFIQKPTTTQN